MYEFPQYTWKIFHCLLCEGVFFTVFTLRLSLILSRKPIFSSTVIVALILVPSVLWCYWLGGRKGTWPVKTDWWDVGMVISLGRDADLHMPSWCHCHSLYLAPVNPDWFYLPGFTFLVLAHPSSPRHSPGSRKIVVVVVVLVVVLALSLGSTLYTSAHGSGRRYYILLLKFLCFFFFFRHRISKMAVPTGNVSSSDGRI